MFADTFLIMETTIETAGKLGLRAEEFEMIKNILDRVPNFTELSAYSVMWSEHCSYKNSIKWLKTLPRDGSSIPWRSSPHGPKVGPTPRALLPVHRCRRSSTHSPGPAGHCYPAGARRRGSSKRCAAPPCSRSRHTRVGRCVLARRERAIPAGARPR